MLTCSDCSCISYGNGACAVDRSRLEEKVEFVWYMFGSCKVLQVNFDEVYDLGASA